VRAGQLEVHGEAGSELAKPDGVYLVAPGTELDRIRAGLRAIPGGARGTAEKLDRLGIQTVADLRRASPNELRREVGQAWAHRNWRAYPSRTTTGPVSPERGVKSISTEDTFDADISDMGVLEAKVTRDADGGCCAAQQRRALRSHSHGEDQLGDFTTHTRSRTLLGAVDAGDVIAESARQLLRGASAQVAQGVRLIGVGVSGFTSAAQEALFEVASSSPDELQVDTVAPTVRQAAVGYQPARTSPTTPGAPAGCGGAATAG